MASDNPFSLAITFADSSKDSVLPILKNVGLQQIDANNLALLEALYNGGKLRKSLKV
jgi:hypothetical protein